MRLSALVAVFLLPLVVGGGVALAMREGGAAARWEVVGHVRPAGHYGGDVDVHAGHAYVSSHRGRESCNAEGVRAFSLADPAQPRLVSTFARIPDTWTEKTVVRPVSTAAFSGSVAAVSVQGCSRQAWRGFVLLDVTRPARPVELARVQLDPRGTHELWLAQAGRRAFVYTAILRSEMLESPDGQRPGRPDFRIYEVTDPRRPQEIGSWGAWRELGVRPFADPRRPLDGNFVHSVVTNAAGTRAYLSYWDLGTVILDVSEPERPRYLGRTPPTSNAHSAWLGRSGLLIETHETPGGRPTLFDVSNPAAPRRLASFTLPSGVLAAGHRASGLTAVSGINLTDSVHDPKISGTTAFLSWYAQGVVAVDVANPSRPRLLARFLPRPAADREKLLCPGRRCVAVWGMDVAGDLVVASDMISGLWVLRLRR